MPRAITFISIFMVRTIHLLTIEQRREHLFCHFGKLIVGLLIVWLLNLSDVSIRVYYEYFTDWYPNINIANCIGLAVTKAAIKWSLVTWEELHNVFEACDFENLGLA